MSYSHVAVLWKNKDVSKRALTKLRQSPSTLQCTFPTLLVVTVFFKLSSYSFLNSYAWKKIYGICFSVYGLFNQIEWSPIYPPCCKCKDSSSWVNDILLWTYTTSLKNPLIDVHLCWIHWRLWIELQWTWVRGFSFICWFYFCQMCTQKWETW